MRAAFAVAAAIVVIDAATLGAQQTARDRITIESYLEWEDVQTPRLSPDGRQIIYVRRWIDKLNDRWESSLWIMNTDGSRNRFLVNGSGVEWSPDGTRIAYLAQGQPAGSQIFVRWMDDEGAISQITRVTESPAEIQWSPDGKSIAFRMRVPHREEWRIPLPSAPRGAKWVEAPRIITSLDFVRTGRALLTTDSSTRSSCPPRAARPDN